MVRHLFMFSGIATSFRRSLFSNVLRKKPVVVTGSAFVALSAYCCFTTLAEEKKKRPVVISGPSGVGKGTHLVINMLLKECPEEYKLCTSHTTRLPRQGEVNGVHYWFVTREEFEKGISVGQFIETNQYNGNLYGTSIEAIKTVSREGKVCILDVDINGAKSVKKTDLNARFFFIKPPGENPFETLKKRLKGRGTDTEEQVEKRLAIAKTELDFEKQNPTFFDQVLVNDVIEQTYQQFKSALRET